MHSEHQDGDIRHKLGQLARGLQSIHSRHQEVQDNQIRVTLLHFFQGIAPIRGFSAHLPAGMLLQHNPKPVSDQRTVIDNENAGLHFNPLVTAAVLRLKFVIIRANPSILWRWGSLQLIEKSTVRRCSGMSARRDGTA